MFLFNLFRKENVNELSGYNERQAAKLLYTIFQDIKSRKDVNSTIDTLTEKIYYLAFRRTNKKIVKLGDALNPLGNANNLAESMKLSMRYTSVYSAIKKTITGAIKNPEYSSISLYECENFLVMILQAMADMINRI